MIAGETHQLIKPGQPGLVRTLLSDDARLINAKDDVSGLGPVIW